MRLPGFLFTMLVIAALGGLVGFDIGSDCMHYSDADHLAGNWMGIHGVKGRWQCDYRRGLTIKCEAIPDACAAPFYLDCSQDGCKLAEKR